jgi:hypothetical protein
MPNNKVLMAARERLQAQAAHAQRVYDGYSDQVNEIIRALDGTSRADQERAVRVLRQMSFLIVPELLAALQNPALNTTIINKVVSLLGDSCDDRAREPLWEYFQQVQGETEQASLIALSLARLGDERVLPFLRDELDCGSPERVINAVSGLCFMGELEDINRLRAIHRCSFGSGGNTRKVRNGAVNAILAILDENGGHSANRTLDQIRNSFADRALWKEISAYTEYSY